MFHLEVDLVSAHHHVRSLKMNSYTCLWRICCCRRHAVTPYCDTVRASPLQLTCRQDQLAVAVCNLQKYPQELPLEYQVWQGTPLTAHIYACLRIKLHFRCSTAVHCVLHPVARAGWKKLCCVWCAVSNCVCCVSISSRSRTWLLISCRSLEVLWRSLTSVPLVRSSAGTLVASTRETPTAECLRTSQVLLPLLCLLLLLTQCCFRSNTPKSTWFLCAKIFGHFHLGHFHFQHKFLSLNLRRQACVKYLMFEFTLSFSCCPVHSEDAFPRVFIDIQL